MNSVTKIEERWTFAKSTFILESVSISTTMYVTKISNFHSQFWVH